MAWVSLIWLSKTVGVSRVMLSVIKIKTGEKN